MELIIDPKIIAEGDAQQVKADLTRFDKAKQQSKIVVAALARYYTIAPVDGETPLTAQEVAAKALETAKLANQVDKAIEEKRKALVNPWNNEVKAINDYAKSLAAPISAGIQKVKDAVMKWQKDEQEKARKAMINNRQTQLQQLGFTYDGANDMYKLEGVAMVMGRELSVHVDAMWNQMIAGWTEMVRRKAEQQVAALEEEKDMVDAFGDAEQVKEVETKINSAVATTNMEAPRYATVSAPVPMKGTTKRWVFEVQDATKVPREYLIVNEPSIRQAINGGIREIPGVRIYQDESISLR
jgi:hypothetical protein